MKRWTITVVAMVSAFALIATPALAADQTRSQDQTCAECSVECDPIQARIGDQTQAQECDPAQVQAQTKTATQLQAKTQAGEPVQAQTKTATQLQAKTQAQVGEPDADVPEWAQKAARFQKKYSKQYAKRVHTVTSSD